MQKYELQPIWQFTIKAFGLDTSKILRRCKLPFDLFEQKSPKVTGEEFFALCRILDAEVGNPLFPLLVGENIHTTHFDPVVYGGFCSANFIEAVQRMSKFRELIAPVKIRMDLEASMTTLTFQAAQPHYQVPDSFWFVETIWWTSFIRSATNEHIIPLRVSTPKPQPPENIEFLGVEVEVSDVTQLTFAANDVVRPFVTANAAMWRYLEPSFEKRLLDCDTRAHASERVRLSLLEVMPSGQCTLQAVAKRLGIGPRTLQRRLSAEDTSFQTVLSATRQELALHYLENTQVSCREISFLLGFEDPNSFFRAFHTWTGLTPESKRRALQEQTATA